ncbi:MAG: DUF2812 domain-containing protein [Saccharofermentans sp.]|nr:DUF2812 domain-containing protein [Clostridiales bacterium]MCR4767814.1 DUF2812 domain-containing protein [Saccharofermentans sp.]
MRRVVHKIYWIWQLEKEEAWINEMASHGYSLEHAGRLTYSFDETEPGKYTYKSLFLKGSANSSENIKYFRFLEEMGITIVCFINYPGTCWVYTRAPREDYPDGIEIYSDIDSKINYTGVMAGYMIFVNIITCFAAMLNLATGLNIHNGFAPVNLIMGVSMLVLFTASVIATVRIFMKIARLKKERAIHE